MICFNRLVLRDDAVGEVRAVETGDEGGVGAQLQVLDDVGADALGGRGGERHDRHAGQEGAELRDLAVFRAEIVAPLGNAVRLVDGEGGDVPRLQVGGPVVEHQTLRGDVEHPPFAAVQSAQAGARLVGVEGGVQVGGGDAGGLQLVHLVLHQGDERRDDDGQARPEQGGQLETKRFAATGRQQGEDVLVRQRGLNDLALQRAEGAVAEGGLEGEQQVVHREEQCGWASEMRPASPQPAKR
jgi:large exoprotein involved in heme utilization and adhesion